MPLVLRMTTKRTGQLLIEVVKETRSIAGLLPTIDLSQFFLLLPAPQTSGAQQASDPKLVDCAPLRLALFARLFQCPVDTFCVEIGAVNRSVRLLTPGLIQAARINAIEPELID